MSALLDSLVAEGLGVGQISDAMDELGLACNAGGGYRLLGGKGGTAFGRAFTLRQIVSEPGGETTIRHGEAALSLASPGDILVIDVGGNTEIVTWGEGHTLRAMINGLRGVVLHGATRDAEALEGWDMPVLCRGTAPVRSKGRLHTAAIGEVLDIAGVRIAPGDLIAINVDGLVAVSKEHEVQVLAKAREILAFEQARDKELSQRLIEPPVAP
ncbi:RraA family protein [Neorhizobium sp. DT-125]|uniref:RraA family protein n=1 Tax=Neorhizobium sp. DT-125 TaxID=3396163 RepID=UPI003F196D11